MVERQGAKTEGPAEKVAVWLLTVAMLGLLLCLCLPLAAFEGWVMHKLWGWYVVHAGLADPVGVLDMIGLSILIKVMRGPVPQQKLREELARSVGLALGALALGWLLLLAR